MKKRGKILKKQRKAIFFSTDALIALTIILLTILVVYPIIKSRDRESDVPGDIIKVLSSLKIGEIDNIYVKTLIAQGKITDLNKNVLEQIGDFYVTNITIAKQLADSVLSTIDIKENIGLWYGSDLLASRNSTPFEKAKNIGVERQIISGISGDDPGESTTGFSARAYLTSAFQKKYFYFGGYVGDGNISVIVDYNGTLKNIDLEAAANTNFSICVNEDDSPPPGCCQAGWFAPSDSQFEPKKFNLTAYIPCFNSGENTIKFSQKDSGKNLFFAGGFIRIIYEDAAHYEQATKHNFQGIEGLINIYDGFYVPGNLNDMEVFLHYYSNYPLLMTIGNVTVFNENSSTETTKTINDSELRNKLNYNEIVGKTIPLRLGLMNISIATGNSADIVFIVDSTASMSNEINDVKTIIINFTKVLANYSVDYRLGLIDFRDYRSAPCGQSGDSDTPYTIHDFYDYLYINTAVKWKNGTLRNITTYGNYIKLLEDPDLYITNPDQSQTSRRNTTTIYGNNIITQTFIPGVDGNLTSLILNVSKYGSPDPIVVEIRNYVGGLPGPTVLATVERNDIGTIQQPYSFNFSSPPSLTKGTTYAIVIKVKDNLGDLTNNYKIAYAAEYWIPESGANQTYVAAHWSGNPYSYGKYCSSLDNGGAWACLDSCSNSYNFTPPCNRTDLYFITYMLRKGYYRRGEAIHIYDAKGVFDWDNFYLYRSLPSGTSTDISFRSSNDNITWSEWFNYGSGTSGNLQVIPDARYLQQKIVLISDGNYTPTIYSTTILSNREAEFTINVLKYQAEVGNVTAKYGGDEPEAHLSALNQSLFMGWRADVKKFEILISDAMPHALDCLKGGGNTYKTCYKGPEYITNVTNDLINNQMTFFYINQQNGLCDDDLMSSNMTNLTGGKFYLYNKANGVQEIIMEIVKNIINLTYSGQTAVSVGNIHTKLYPDSYIKFNYTKTSFPYGLITTTENRFYDNYSGNFSIPGSSEILEAVAISYSGPRWTDNVMINGNSIYNLADYGLDYTKLGDPYAIRIPNSRVQGNGIVNNVRITTGLSPAASTYGSKNNTIIYTIKQNASSYSPVVGFAKGCNWSIEFEDSSTLNLKIPESYSGAYNCYFSESKTECETIKGPMKNCENSDDVVNSDAIQIAVYKLLRLLDLNSNNKTDVKFAEQDLQVGFTQITGIPFTWSTEVQVRKWD